MCDGMAYRCLAFTARIADTSGYRPGMGTRRYAMYIETLIFFAVIAAVFAGFFALVSKATHHKGKNA